MADSDNPSKLSVALAKAAVQEIGEAIVSAEWNWTWSADPDEFSDEMRARFTAIIARYIEMVR
jgi:hypothetical protein